jgi:hypothetical protein
MVSYPESHSEAALAIRRPPSVASHSSRASTARRHRPHRSHFGGNSYAPQNEFPIFTHTGDVEIVISNGRKEQRYLLHKLILTQCSGFFEAGTSEEWANAGDAGGNAPSASALARMPSGARQEKTKWRYELDWGKGEDDLPMLVQKVRYPPRQTLFPPHTDRTQSRRHNLPYSAATPHPLPNHQHPATSLRRPPQASSAT